MARTPRSGATFATLYEYEVTLDDVISVLRFHPLSKEDEALFRSRMGRSIGQWLMAEGDYQRGAKLDISDVQQSLERLAAHLERADRFVSAADEGVHDVHDVEVASRLVSALKENPAIGSIETARDIVVAFQEQAKIIAEGARVAAALLELTPTKAGRIRKAWLDEFTRAVMHVCTLNAVKSVINLDRDTREPKGRFFEAATAFQQLLPPGMRAHSPEAFAQALQRSMKRLKSSKRPDDKNPPRARGDFVV